MDDDEFDKETLMLIRTFRRFTIAMMIFAFLLVSGIIGAAVIWWFTR